MLWFFPFFKDRLRNRKTFRNKGNSLMRENRIVEVCGAGKNVICSLYTKVNAEMKGAVFAFCIFISLRVILYDQEIPHATHSKVSHHRIEASLEAILFIRIIIVRIAILILTCILISPDTACTSFTTTTTTTSSITIITATITTTITHPNYS